jgi:hypothetical protein
MAVANVNQDRRGAQAVSNCAAKASAKQWKIDRSLIHDVYPHECTGKRTIAFVISYQMHNRCRLPTQSYFAYLPVSCGVMSG